jgi:hypothetical protein
MQLNDTQRACTGSELAVGAPLLGWREWTLTDGGLHGAQGRLWTPGVNAARCHGRHATVLQVLDKALAAVGIDTPRHTVEPWCTCGLYSWKRPDRIGARSTKVAGVVELWGRVLVGEHGYRAQYAQVAAVCGPPGSDGTGRPAGPGRTELAVVAARYGVPHFQTLDEAVDHFAEGR